MIALRTFSAVCLVVASLGAPVRGYADEMRHQTWGQWSGGAFSNDQTKQFSHCAASVPYRSGILMAVSVNRSFGWSLGFFDPGWNFTPGQSIPVTISFDGGAPWNGTARVIKMNFVEIPMDANSSLIGAFRAALRMTAYASGQTFVFNLDGTSRLMPALAQCVATQLAMERGDPPPNLANNSPPVQSVSPRTGQSSQQPNAAELELSATRIASNLLLQAKLPNARLLSRAETPENIRRLGVAWRSDAGLGAVELLSASAGKDPQQIASQIITSDAATCKGDFASGRSSELIDNTVVTKAFTGCKSSSGSNMIRYFVLHNEGAGYIVYALASEGTADQPSTSPLSDANFEPAAIKAAFAP